MRDYETKKTAGAPEPPSLAQGGKGDLIWQLSCIYETITTKIFKKIIKFFIDFLETFR